MLYDDRLIIECNLIQAYDSIMQFIVKHMPEIPFIDGTLRLPLRDVIMREVVLNMLIHREYSGGGGIMLHSLYIKTQLLPRTGISPLYMATLI